MATLTRNSEPSALSLLRVRGRVQGVGFRPFVYRLALEHGVTGWVRNDVHGVTIEATAAPEVLEHFKHALTHEAPPAALVEEVLELASGPASGASGFVILESENAESVTTLISPDLPVCPDCLREMRNPTDPRYRYPFINCTNCGPRYSIIEALPYDRPKTTMKSFPMCPRCELEYHDPLDRRFHAQPTACPDCGPELRYVIPPIPLETNAIPPLMEGGLGGDLAVQEAVAALKAGRILAIKGLGGYHLACDARNEEAVETLRERKFRKEKPFALMAKDVAALEGYIELTPAARVRVLLESPARPIVLLPKGEKGLPEALAPENAYLGVMLPYTPLHHLLFDDGAPELLVMTSANRSSEPIAYQDEEALTRLSGLADAFLIGERPIARRVDDSVAALVNDIPVIVRRARGYAPAPVTASPRFEQPILALGAELKNSITLAAHGYAFVSQHLGELSNLESFQAFEETVHDLLNMYRVNLSDCLLVHDLHPAYPSSRYAQEKGVRTLAVQHHKAHIASVLAEKNAWDVPVLGFAFDGTGLGEDNTVWGGEIFHGALEAGFGRVGHLRHAHLPGGDAAARTPVQAAVGFVAALGDEALERLVNPPFCFPEARVKVARSLIKSGLNCPVTSSMGRLFDTVSALTGFHKTMSFEGQAAIRLEALTLSAPLQLPYPLPFDGRVWDYAPMLGAVIDDVAKGVAPAVIARRFHEGLAQGVIEAVLQLREQYPFEAVVLSGGVFHNHLLSEAIYARLDVPIWMNAQVPAGDGGISLGQAALAAGGSRCV